MTNLLDTVVEVARAGHRAALASSHWPAALSAHEAEVSGDPSPIHAPPPDHLDRAPQDDRRDESERPRDADEPAPLRVAPFTKGDLVVDRHAPYHAAVVERCYPYPSGRGWCVETSIVPCPGCGAIYTTEPAERLMRVPSDWEDCPGMPETAIAMLERSTDGPLSRVARQAAYDADAGDARQHAWRDYFVRRRLWAETQLWPISRELGNAEIAGCDERIREIDTGDRRPVMADAAE